MKEAHQKPSNIDALVGYLTFFLRFKRLRESRDIDKPYLSYSPSYEYAGENIDTIQYDFNLQMS